MHTDANLHDRFSAMMRELRVPAVSPQAVRSRRTAAARHTIPYARVALAACAVVAAGALAFPSTSAALVRSAEERLRELALGYPAPPQPSKVFVNSLQQQETTLDQARTHVSFTLVPPAGLPSDASPPRVTLAQSGAFARPTETWQKGASIVTFGYRRANGRWFTLRAERYDPASDPQAKYIIDADASHEVNGHPRIVKYEHFAWHNGDQMMSATADGGITAREIDRIRLAMGGVELPRRDGPPSGGPTKIYRIQKP